MSDKLVSNNETIKGLVSHFHFFGAWDAKKFDKNLTAAVRKQYNISSGTLATQKTLFPPDKCGERNPHVVWKSLCGKLRNRHYGLSLVWDPGQLVTLEQFDRYDTEVSQANGSLWKETQAAFEDFITWYSTGIELAKQGLNGAFNEADYPTVAKLRDRFDFQQHYETVAEASPKWAERILTPALAKALEAQQERNKVLLANAVADVFDKALLPLKALTDTLAKPGAIFRDSLVGNIREVLELLPAHNLTGDHQVLELKNQIELVLAGVTPEALRDNTVLRSEVVAKGMAIRNLFGERGRKYLDAVKKDAEKQAVKVPVIEVEPETAETEETV